MNRIQQGQGCPTCGNIRSKDCERLTTKDVISKLESVNFFENYSLIDVNDYVNANKKTIRIICKKCQKEFLGSFVNMMANHGCPYCRHSKIEQESKRIFKEKGITIIHDHFRGFKELRGTDGKRPLEIDFVIEINGKEIYIELNGEFHFKGCTHFKFKRERDNFIEEFDKKKIDFFLEKNSSIFIAIPFWEFKNIEKIYASFFKDNFEHDLKEFDITVISNNKEIQKIKNIPLKDANASLC